MEKSKLSSSAWNKLMGVQKVSSCDHPHGLCSTLFFGSCNMRCPTCHNKDIAWELTDEPPFDRDTLLVHLKHTASMGYLDRITVTGGEPLNVECIESALSEIQSLGFRVKLDTNGMQADRAIDLLTSGVVDMLAVDIKGPFEKYRALSGGTHGMEEAKGEIEKLILYSVSHPEKIYFRTTLVPILDLDDVARVQRMIPKGVQWNTQNYVDPTKQR